jgi:PAS domain S-box-containing protein
MAIHGSDEALSGLHNAQGETCPFPSPTESEYMLLAQSLLAGTLDYALLIDPQGIILTANTQCGELFNCPTEKLFGKSLFQILPSTIAAPHRAYLNQALRTGNPMYFNDISRPEKIYNTRIQPLRNSKGEISRLAIFARDVSFEKTAERRHLLLATALENTAEAIIITDKRMRIEYVNQTFEAMTGFPQFHIKGRNLSELYIGREQKEQFHIIRRGLNQGEVWAGRCSTTNRDGSVLECDKTISPIRGMHGVVVGYVSVWRDLEQISKLERQLREAQKMEAIGTLAGGIAHDFNNILSPIMLHAELVISQIQADSQAHDSLEQIVEAAKRAANLVDQILNISRKKSTDSPIPFSLTPLIKECIKLLRPSLPPSIRIIFTPAQEPDVIVAAPAQIHQVIMNLCTNAAHALKSVGGGDLILRVERVDNAIRIKNKHKHMSYPALPPGDYVKLSVQDNGPGIPQSIMDKIFDPFFTTKKAKGTGLGLSVVRGIVSRHKGGVLVDSRPNEGAGFHVLLPCAANHNVDPRTLPPKSPQTSEGRGERILLVDDDDAVASSLTATLLRLGYEVRTVRSSRRALEIFTGNPDSFDAIITDLSMPGIPGDELAARMHKINPDMPIILGSGRLPSPEEIESMPGVRLALGKPYRSEQLATALRQVLDAPAHPTLSPRR